jgi:hypothetical protein
MRKELRPPLGPLLGKEGRKGLNGRGGAMATHGTDQRFGTEYSVGERHHADQVVGCDESAVHLRVGLL